MFRYLGLLVTCSVVFGNPTDSTKQTESKQRPRYDHANSWKWKWTEIEIQCTDIDKDSCSCTLTQPELHRWGDADRGVYSTYTVKMNKGLWDRLCAVTAYTYCDDVEVTKKSGEKLHNARLEVNIYLGTKGWYNVWTLVPKVPFFDLPEQCENNKVSFTVDGYQVSFSLEIYKRLIQCMVDDPGLRRSQSGLMSIIPNELTINYHGFESAAGGRAYVLNATITQNGEQVPNKIVELWPTNYTRDSNRWGYLIEVVDNLVRHT